MNIINQSLSKLKTVQKTYLSPMARALAPHMGGWGVFCLLTFLSPTARAQAPHMGGWGVGLSLSQCRQMAVEHNVKMRNARNDIAASKEQRKEAFTNYFPTVSATGVGFDANKDILSMSMMGMDVSMLKDGIGGSVSAVQPVFAGGRIVNGNKLAKVGEDVSKLQMEQAENEVELTAEQYYWQLVTLNEKMRTVNTVDSMLSRICKDVETAVKAGVAMRNDLLQVQLKQNDIAATRSNLQAGISTMRSLLAQYIGADSATVHPTEHIALGIMPESPIALRVDHQSSLSATPEYQLLEKNVEASRLQKKMTIGENLPQVGVGASYMYNNFMDKDRSYGMVFASVSVPLSGWWGGSHAIKRSKIQLAKAQDQLQDNSELLVIRMQKAWDDLDNAYRQLTIARQSMEQSEENLRLNNDYYRAGTTKMSDLMDAQTMYQQSRDKFVEAYAQYNVKRTEYLQATGR